MEGQAGLRDRVRRAAPRDEQALTPLLPLMMEAEGGSSLRPLHMKRPVREEGRHPSVREEGRHPSVRLNDCTPASLYSRTAARPSARLSTAARPIGSATARHCAARLRSATARRPLRLHGGATARLHATAATARPSSDRRLMLMKRGTRSND